MFNNIYKGKKVFVTGHTGFKGSWLTVWLKHLKAEVTGYALAPPTTPNHHDLLKLDYEEIIHPITDIDYLEKCIKDFYPDVVMHLAAQPIVSTGYQKPWVTFKTNVLGTLNVLEICRNTPSVKVVINVTSDKCYMNKNWGYDYRENDELGGSDPYSASKTCSEIITKAYRESFTKVIDNPIHITTVRAGNVLGGGDWSQDRLIPDLVRGIVDNYPVQIRNLYSVRAWIHVLDCLYGYLLLGQKLLENKNLDGAWNFGPDTENIASTEKVIKEVSGRWKKVEIEPCKITQYIETHSLTLDNSKAKRFLGWNCLYDFNETIYNTIKWYKEFYLNDNVITMEQIKEYEEIREAQTRDT